jgi:iron complex outermembrane receptor protein
VRKHQAGGIHHDRNFQDSDPRDAARLGRHAVRRPRVLAQTPPAADQTPQQTAPDDGAQVDDVVVTGIRATQRSSIAVKRDSATIVDAIVNDEIGSQPDNSVGDTLERITGVTADRFKGNANELSVRGLGPTLSFSTFNGREVSTAGPDRSVAFQQFPSELVNGVLVYKTQQADFPEGGIAGVIDLRSIRPLDARPRIQAEYRGVYQDKEAAVPGRDGFGYRANISVTNRWRDTSIGDIGVSLGYQHQDQAGARGLLHHQLGLHSLQHSGEQSEPDHRHGGAAGGGGHQLQLRHALDAQRRQPGRDDRGADLFRHHLARLPVQKTTSEIRDGLIGALQWRPTDRLDFALDGQYSNRSSLENRNILAITEAARGIRPLAIGGRGRRLTATAP